MPIEIWNMKIDSKQNTYIHSTLNRETKAKSEEFINLFNEVNLISYLNNLTIMTLMILVMKMCVCMAMVFKMIIKNNNIKYWFQVP